MTSARPKLAKEYTRGEVRAITSLCIATDVKGSQHRLGIGALRRRVWRPETRIGCLIVHQEGFAGTPWHTIAGRRSSVAEHIHRAQEDERRALRLGNTGQSLNIHALIGAVAP